MTKLQWFQRIFETVDEEKDLHGKRGEVILELIGRVWETVRLMGWPFALEARQTELDLIADLYRALPPARGGSDAVA